jgi:hypothetical protein
VPFCNAPNCLALATHGDVCAVHAKHPAVLVSPGEMADLLTSDIDYDFLPKSYLLQPGAEDEEWVNIATITVKSVLSDTISIDARERWEGIDFQVRDDSGGVYEWKPRTRKQPFTLRELISFIDSARGPWGRGLVRGVLEYNCREGRMDPAELEHFLDVSSEAYPDLGKHYQADVLRWIGADAT